MTEREKELLEYIIEYKKVNGFSPSYADMKDGINTKSNTHINIMLDHLEDDGYIKRRKNQARTIKVIRFK